MRADRLISILLLLQSHGRMTAKQLAERLEVSERTVYRDMEALSRAGIPVVADRGVGGGWRLMEKYRTNLTGFKEKEIQALFVSPPAHLLDDLGLTRSAEDARNKLLAAIPDTYRHGAKEVWQRIHVDTRAWRKPEETVAAFETLQQAIWEEKRLHILYRRSDGDTVERTVDPLGLVAKGSVWYLVASIDETVRTYRASRILSAASTNERFVRPTDFDLAQYWESFYSGVYRSFAGIRNTGGSSALRSSKIAIRRLVRENSCSRPSFGQRLDTCHPLLRHGRRGEGVRIRVWRQHESRGTELFSP